MELYETVFERRSVRKYSGKPVEEDKLLRILEAAQKAPSACNRQPWHIVVIRDEMRRQALGKAYPRDWFCKAPVIICACGDPAANWARMDGKNYNDVDVAIAMDHLILAATTEGLGTCWIGAFDPKIVRDVLKLPAGIEPVAMTPLGYPDDPPKQSSRKTLKELVHWETY